MSGYHRISPRIATNPVEVECPECEDDIQVWSHDTEVECMGCGFEYAVARAQGGAVSLEPLPVEGEGWQAPERLYHGTSLKRVKEMLASPKSFELYLAASEGGTTGYAEAASAEDESPGATVVFDTEKLLSRPACGQLWPDWDDVNMLIESGEDLFGDATSANDVSWMDSLRVIGTCSYEGDMFGAIVEVLTDGGVFRPPFEELR